MTLRDAVEEDLPRARRELEELVRIPSVSAPGFDADEVRRSAEAAAAIVQASGAEGVRLLQVEGGHPAVFGEIPPPAGAPTVLLYAHHDVQPPNDLASWDTPPFEPIEREGRLYGRGASDDKAGVAAHAAAIRAHGGRPPVGVKLLLEGEEEVGSPTLPAFLARYADLLDCDVIVLADMSNWRVGQPALTTSLRGLVDCVVEVRTLEHAVHSGMFGGPYPDALTALARLLATLHDDEGNVALAGLHAAPSDELDLTERELREQASAIQGLERIGGGTLTGQLWTMPAISVVGIDAPTVQEAANQLVPAARAKVSLRIAPGDEPAAAMDALVTHLESNAPWGARVTVARGAAAAPFAVRTDGPAYAAAIGAIEEAFGARPFMIGGGGTIPFMAAFAETFPRAEILCTGLGDPDSRWHGANESQHLGDFRNAILAEALLLERLAP